MTLIGEIETLKGLKFIQVVSKETQNDQYLLKSLNS